MNNTDERRGTIKEVAARVANFASNSDPVEVLRDFLAIAKDENLREELHAKIAFHMEADPETKTVTTHYALSLDALMEAEGIKGNPTHPENPTKALRHISEKLVGKDCFATLSPYNSQGPQCVIFNQLIQNEDKIHQMNQVLHEHNQGLEKGDAGHDGRF